ncbi:hypothetical protein L9F63_001165, partial [Diploptera punctata]
AVPPLTSPLTASQAMAKEIQKQDLANQSAGKSKILTKAIQKIEQHEIKKLLQRRTASFSSVNAVKYSGTTRVGVNCTSASVDGIVKQLEQSTLVEGKDGQMKCNELAGVSQSRRESTLNYWKCDSDVNPIENDEWLAFLQHTMEEIMEGEVDSLQQCSFVGVVVSPLRNSSASCRVMEYVSCLLSLPFVVGGVTEEDISKLRQVYLEVKIVPNLVYASKLLARRKGYDSDDPMPPQCPVSDLSADELQALECMYLLLCNLVHTNEHFLLQFCDSVVILNATTLLQQLLLLDRRKIRVVTDLVAILCHILRELPENASLVEQIIFTKGLKGSAGVDIIRMLTHHSPTLKSRTCALLQLLGRYSCQALRSNWNMRLREELENLQHDSSHIVEMAAKEAVGELKQLAFYSDNKIMSDIEIIKKCEQAVSNHKAYLEKYRHCSEWLSLAQGRYESCRDGSSVGARQDLVERSSGLKELLLEQPSATSLLNNTIEVGEKLYPSTAMEGREVVRQELQDLQQALETLYGGVSSTERELRAKLNR